MQGNYQDRVGTIESLQVKVESLTRNVKTVVSILGCKLLSSRVSIGENVINPLADWLVA